MRSNEIYISVITRYMCVCVSCGAMCMCYSLYMCIVQKCHIYVACLLMFVYVHMYMGNESCVMKWLYICVYMHNHSCMCTYACAWMMHMSTYLYSIVLQPSCIIYGCVCICVDHASMCICVSSARSMNTVKDKGYLCVMHAWLHN